MRTLSLHHDGLTYTDKNGKQTRWAVKEASKAFYGYPRAGVGSKWYTAHLFSQT